MQPNIIDLLTEEEKTAIAVLSAGGFVSLSAVKIADCRDLASGNRYRTFRNRGRYDIVIGCRNLARRTLPEPILGMDPEVKTIDTPEDLQALFPDLCRQMIDDALQGFVSPVLSTDETPAPTEIFPPTELKPVADMRKEDLLAEARLYPELTGESRMNKPELAAAIQAQRDRRALIHRSFRE